MQRHPVDPEVFMWMDFALNVNVYNLQLGLDWIGLRMLDISNAETPSGSRGFHLDGFCSKCQCVYRLQLGLQMGHLLVYVLHCTACRDGRKNKSLGF